MKLFDRTDRWLMAYKNLAFVVFFVLTTVMLHNKSYDQGPSGTHAWSQSDHYAVSLGFLENDFNFFQPISFALTHQFPPIEALNNPQGITAIDFPILHYTAALLMKGFKTTDPWAYRSLCLLWSFIALLTFFNAIVRIKGFWAALGLTGFIMFQPIYCYYQNSFHVASAAFNSFLMGASFIISYYNKPKLKIFLAGIFFLTLAALMRFPQIISLLALICLYLYKWIIRKERDTNLIFVLFSVAVVLCYFIYNKYLQMTYGSLFVGTPVFADSISHFFICIFKIGYTYLRSFLPFVHLFAVGILFMLFKDRERGKITEDLMIWLTFSFLGTLAYSILMIKNMTAHEYYALDTWLPVLVLLLTYLVWRIDLKPLSSKLVKIGTLFFLVSSFTLALEHQIRRYPDDGLSSTADLIIKDFKNSADFLNTHVSKEAEVLIICPEGWNTPMIGWQRSAYRVASRFAKHIPIALSKKYDFIITHNATFKNTVANNYPDFKDEVEYVEGNAKISIWRLKRGL